MERLWIALKFFVLLQSKQQDERADARLLSCELLSNFLYFCSRNNGLRLFNLLVSVVNCSQIFCTFAVETTRFWLSRLSRCCELLSNFLYFCSRNNLYITKYMHKELWIALKFFVLLQSKQLCLNFAFTELLWIALKFFVLLQSKQQEILLEWEVTGCELLSNFLYFCSRNNPKIFHYSVLLVVNCSQIFCTFAVETTKCPFSIVQFRLWIALKFFVLLQSKQPLLPHQAREPSCELLSNFLYFCSRNNKVRRP